VAVSLDVHCSGEGKKGGRGRSYLRICVCVSLSLSLFMARGRDGMPVGSKHCHSLSMVKYHNLTMVKYRTYPVSAVRRFS